MRRLLRLPLPAAFARAGRQAGVVLAAFALSGCWSLPLQPPIDLSGPGWVVREGQGVWRPRSGADGIAGDLLVATHPDGRSVVQFTKTPLPFLVAQRTPQGWQVQFIPRNKTYSGRGEPPARLLWLHLPQALVRGKALDSFLFATNAAGGWRFERQATGESLEGYLEPVSSTNKLPARTTGGAQPDTSPGVLPYFAIAVRGKGPFDSFSPIGGEGRDEGVAQHQTCSCLRAQVACPLTPTLSPDPAAPKGFAEASGGEGARWQRIGAVSGCVPTGWAQLGTRINLTDRWPFLVGRGVLTPPQRTNAILCVGTTAPCGHRALPAAQAMRPFPYGVPALAGNATNCLLAGPGRTRDRLNQGLRA